MRFKPSLERTRLPTRFTQTKLTIENYRNRNRKGWHPPVGTGLTLVPVFVRIQFLVRMSNWLPGSQSFLFMAKADGTLWRPARFFPPPPPWCLWHKLWHPEEGSHDRFYEMNSEGPTDVSVPPFHRKCRITTRAPGDRELNGPQLQNQIRTWH